MIDFDNIEDLIKDTEERLNKLDEDIISINKNFYDLIYEIRYLKYGNDFEH